MTNIIFYAIMSLSFIGMIVAFVLFAIAFSHYHDSYKKVKTIFEGVNNQFSQLVVCADRVIG